MMTSRTLSCRPIRTWLSRIPKRLLDGWYEGRQGDCLKASTTHGSGLKQRVDKTRADRDALSSGVA